MVSGLPKELFLSVISRFDARLQSTMAVVVSFWRSLVGAEMRRTFLRVKTDLIKRRINR